MLSDKPFQCAVCQQVLADPVTTPCGHNFCQACIRKEWDSSEVCQCPACGRTFRSRPETSINAAFKELVEAFKNMMVCSPAPPLPAAEPGAVACDVCAAASLRATATKSCLVCLTSYCQAHLEPHQRVSTLKLHQLIAPVKNLPDRMCKKHQRLLEVFCRDEQRCVCRFCTETEHKYHHSVAVEDESPIRKVQQTGRLVLKQRKGDRSRLKTELCVHLDQAQIKQTTEEFQQMIQERLTKVEEIQNCLKLSAVSLMLYPHLDPGPNPNTSPAALWSHKPACKRLKMLF